jgi:osmotically-inducible protein OsmY
MKSDQELKKELEAELRWDPRLNESDIAVSVKAGTVTLSGFAHSYGDKHDAEVAVKRVAGVAAVANDIEVRLPSRDERPDPEIARDVVSGLKSQLPFSCEHIKPVVSQGRVVLEGELDWNYQRETAEAAARRVKGVKAVANRIQIKFRPTPAEVKQKIEEAFKRSAAIDALGITVEAREGDVILKGSVRSWVERQEADRAAWAAPGVKHVDNRITVSL